MHYEIYKGDLIMCNCETNYPTCGCNCGCGCVTGPTAPTAPTCPVCPCQQPAKPCDCGCHKHCGCCCCCGCGKKECPKTYWGRPSWMMPECPKNEGCGCGCCCGCCAKKKPTHHCCCGR